MELLVVISIAGLLSAMAFPSMSSLVNEIRLSAAMSNLVNDMQFARSEAIKRSVRVLVCPQSACAGFTASAWSNGWRVCYDADANGDCDTGSTANPNPFRSKGAISSPQTLSGPTVPVRFGPMGTANVAAAFSLTSSVAGSSSWTGTVAATGVITSRKGG